MFRPCWLDRSFRLDRIENELNSMGTGMLKVSLANNRNLNNVTEISVLGL